MLGRPNWVSVEHLCLANLDYQLGIRGLGVGDRMQEPCLKFQPQQHQRRGPVLRARCNTPRERLTV